MSTFTTTLRAFEESKLWGYHILVEMEQAAPFLNGDKRVICTVNQQTSFHAALMSNGKGEYFILFSKDRCKALKLRLNDPLLVHLAPDESKYGMPLAEEFEEMMYQDPEGDRLFHALTPGKQRNLLHIINSAKSSDLRITRSYAILEHLKANKGKIEFRQLQQDFKSAKDLLF
jgi:Bacteriocin-protection, YdeI or OmpD-Associated/Domain of unknown function (DUF1905)